ncbi:MerR family transcriptional regulator [Agrococcus baldri]|uniref:MerR family transcriptional regulator n=1 Tax=Agrococcus baldri TaxID=153730 RepID=A0AA87RJ87_9MICO|nr:MerR family transcriptional regulator [Agrococcus baldri]GEK79212.1 MerR family transcriptional regulator [Agrococcus baldri]
MTERDVRMPIGEFSRITWLSPKALRLYERRGLLLPDVVDGYTGYRYYVRSQAARAREIALLRRAGVPLERIAAMLDADPPERQRLVQAYRAELDRAHERSVAMLDDLARGRAAADAVSDAAVRVRATPPRAFVVQRIRTTAADLPSHIERLAASLTQRAGSAVDGGAPLVVAYHGEVSWESDGPVEVRVPLLDAGVADATEEAGEEAWVAVPYGDVQFPTILRSFEAVRAAAARDGRTPAGPPRELYLHGAPFRCEVAQPFVTA